jgi:hypothetical protein
MSFLSFFVLPNRETERITMAALNHGPQRATPGPKSAGKLMPLIYGLIIGFVIAYQIMPQAGKFNEDCDSDRRNNEQAKEVDKLAALVPPSYRLAYEQSMGFFDDIPESQWTELYQRRARNATHHLYPKKPLRDWREPAMFYLKNYEPTFTCPQVRRVGGTYSLLSSSFTGNAMDVVTITAPPH